MKRIIYNSLLFVILSLSTINAQPRKLSLDECRSLALTNNTAALVAEQTQVKADDMVGAMFANFLPQLSLQGLYVYSDLDFDYKVSGGTLPIYKLDPSTGKYVIDATVSSLGLPILNSYAFFPDIEMHFKTDNIWYAAAQLRQPIFMGGKVTAGYRMAKIGREMAELNRAKTDAEVLLSVDEAYWNCVKAQVLQTTAEQYASAVDEFYATMSNAVSEGMRPSNDLLKVEIKRGEAELNLAKVLNAQRLASMNLCQTIGIELLTEIEIDTLAIDRPIEFSFADCDLSERPEVALLQRQVELKEQEIAVTRADFLPQIGLQASYGYMNGGMLNDTKIFDNRSSLTGMVSVSIPIFHWGEGARKTSAARVEKTIAELQQRDLRQKMSLEVEMYRNACNEASLQVKINERIVESATENMRVIRNRYDQVMDTIAAVLESQTEWQKASTDLVESKVALRMAYSRYLKAAGRLIAPAAE